MSIFTIEQIENRLNEIQGTLIAPYEFDNGHIIMSRLNDLAAYMAESGKLKADAEYHLLSKTQTQVIKALKDLLPEYASAKMQNDLIKGLVAKEQSLVTFADRVNRSCVHQIDVMRTQLSYLKELSKF